MSSKKFNVKVSVFDVNYIYKAKNKQCYFCGKKVKKYKMKKCKCKRTDCELCQGNRPPNFPICENCVSGWVEGQRKRNPEFSKKKDKKDK